ncbi:lipopolysaccharide biosynthesis protein [Cytobacillus oceanisediminis]|uniref:lipopolysaccharide biosynthesis protein n=1 Tax=Cytobacillus oceanisediminis TaxID=665099 RepID=UPI0024959474|nr:oligosaccharide flippase family protein [Cytobacillus oceanisediminis]
MVKGIMSNTKFGKDILITILGQVIVLLVAFGLNKILSIRLGAAGFGEYSIAKRTADVIAFSTLAGMGIAIPRYLAIYRQKGEKLKEARILISGLIIISLLSLVTLTLLISFKVPFARIIFGIDGYESYILPLLLYALTSTLTSFSYAYFRGIDSFYKFNLSQIIVQLSMLIVAFIFGGNIITLLYMWSLVAGLFGITICLKLGTKYISYANLKSFKNDLKSYITELVSFSVPRIPGEFVLFAYTVVPLIIISYKLGVEASGYFSAAITINSMINPLFGFIGMVLLPLVSRSIVSNQLLEVDNTIKLLGYIYLMFGILGIVFVEIFTSLVIDIMFSSDFQSALPIVRILIIAIVPNSLYLLLRNPIDAISKTPYNTFNLIISFTVLIISSFFSSSTTAFAWSFVFSYTLLGSLSVITWQMSKNKAYAKDNTNKQGYL